MKIYTRTGDQGKTRFLGGDPIPKYHRIVSAYGTVDELNATLGLALTQTTETHLAELIDEIQHQLFDLGMDIATPLDKETPKIRRMAEEEVVWLEQKIDELEEQLPKLTHFIIPGGSASAAPLHLARTVCRRAERLLVKASTNTDINPETIKYLNRLSDLLFVMARTANHQNNTPEKKWPRDAG